MKQRVLCSLAFARRRLLRTLGSGALLVIAVLLAMSVLAIIR